MKYSDFRGDLNVLEGSEHIFDFNDFEFKSIHGIRWWKEKSNFYSFSNNLFLISITKGLKRFSIGDYVNGYSGIVVGWGTVGKIGGKKIFTNDGSVDKSFTVRRLYILSNSNRDLLRGSHAHIELNQIFYCVKGRINLLLNDGRTLDSKILLDKSMYFLSAGLWRDLIFSSRSDVLVVFADRVFDENDYIRNFSDFINWKLGNGNS